MLTVRPDEDSSYIGLKQTLLECIPKCCVDREGKDAAVVHIRGGESDKMDTPPRRRTRKRWGQGAHDGQDVPTLARPENCRLKKGKRHGNKNGQSTLC